VVEVAMMSSVYPSLLSNLGMCHDGDVQTSRTGNRHGGLTMAPYNVYPTADGQIAILSVDEHHWCAIAQVLGHPEWSSDARFATKADRIRHMDELDRMIGEVTVKERKAPLFERLVAARVPSAPVRELPEVVNDEHLHATGMLRWIEHPEYGRMLAHGSPIVFKGESLAPYRASARLGADARDVLRDLLALDDEGFDMLKRSGAIA
jgi:formyl-CoA transferase